MFTNIIANDKHPLVELGVRSLADLTVVLMTAGTKQAGDEEQRAALLQKVDEAGMQNVLMYDKASAAKHWGRAWQDVKWVGE